MNEKVPVIEGLFAESPEGYTLLAYKCTSCEQVHFPRAERCLSCLCDDLEKVPLSGRGKLFSYTVVQMPASHFQPPYAVGYVDLAEGIRIFTPLDIVENKPFQVGMEMEINTGPLWQEDDKDVVGYRFSPV